MELFAEKKKMAKILFDKIFDVLNGLMRAFPSQKQDIESSMVLLTATIDFEEKECGNLVNRSLTGVKKTVNDLIENLTVIADKDKLDYDSICNLLEHFDYALWRGMPFYIPEKNAEMRARIKEANEKIIKKIELEKARERWKEILNELEKLS